MESLILDGPLTVLTGAGISAESGIPTFRGPEGYWSVDSKNYHPQEMATYAMFRSQPDEVWKWYLYRLSVCRDAKPNPGHLALVELEKILGDQFTLITQNVDNLHLKAGNSLERTLQIHGNVFFMRCTRECQGRIYPLPMTLFPRDKDQDLSEDDRALLSCPDCDEMTRPHVLWFDETYDEHYFRFDSAIAAADKSRILIIAGTSGSTNLPNLVANTVYRNRGTIVDININENPFSALAENSTGGLFLQKSCSEGLAELVATLNSD